MNTNLHLLLLDDDEIYNRISARILQKVIPTDFKLDAFTSPNQTLDYIGGLKKWPDYIILNIMMPEMDGWNFMRNLKNLANGEPIPSKIILLTTSLREEDKNMATTFDCVIKYLHKPLDPVEFKQVLSIDSVVKDR